MSFNASATFSMSIAVSALALPPALGFPDDLPFFAPSAAAATRAPGAPPR
jgi:hypothetical protein